MRRVVITGIGVISPQGNDAETLFSNLMEGRSAVREVVTEGPKGPHANVGAAVTFDAAQYISQRVDQLDRVTQFSIAAAALAVKDAAIGFTDANR
ncbi:MAG: 3-oxoacyl-[acyl-carrier-protein] synthase, partial [Thermoanaerobaculia bacterium]|nr:3-oxoacyl-[acyl-carrier-protein] synthase [Thermoanaerobaculia bacterium]